MIKKTSTFLIQAIYRHRSIAFFMLLFIAWLALCMLVFRGKGFLVFGDFSPALSKSQYLFTWNSKNLGYDNSAYLTTAPYWALSHLFVNTLGLNNGTKISYLLPLLYFSATIYWVLYYCRLKERYCLLFGVLAMFNPISIGYMHNGGVDVTLIGFSNIIWSLLFFYTWLKTMSIKYLILSGVFSAFILYIVYFFIFLLLAVVLVVATHLVNKNTVTRTSRAVGYFSLILFYNLYWLIPFLYSVSFQKGLDTILPSSSGYSVLFSLAPSASILNAISLYYYGSLQNNLGFGTILDISLIVLLGICISLLFFKTNKPLARGTEKTKIFLILMCLFLVSLFFATGPNRPYGSIFSWFFVNVPLFQGFRTYMRFNVVIFICYIAFAALVVNETGGKVRRAFLLLLLSLIVYFGQHYAYIKIRPVELPIPYGNYILNPSRLDGNTIDAPLTLYNQHYVWGETSIMSHLSERSFWYYYTGYIENNSARENIVKVYNNTAKTVYLGLLNSLYNVKDVIYHKDRAPSTNPKGNLSEYKDGNGFLKLVDDNSFYMHYKTVADSYLPHIYIPEYVRSFTNTDDLLNNDGLNYNNDITVYFQNRELYKQTPRTIHSKLTALEYRKISPVKYRVIIHRVKNEQLIVFSESFSAGWKIHLIKNSNGAKYTADVTELPDTNYHTLTGNEDYQATEGDLTTYLINGWISTLGDGKVKQTKHYRWENGKKIVDYTEKYKVDFISKYFHGTIQNDNLSNGYFWETWLPNKTLQLPEENHLLVNGYANSWTINTDKYCNTGTLCIKNPDGTYDMEFVIEYWPQRLYYIGTFISVFSLLYCIVYLACKHMLSKHK